MQAILRALSNGRLNESYSNISFIRCGGFFRHHFSGRALSGFWEYLKNSTFSVAGERAAKPRDRLILLNACYERLVRILVRSQ